MSACRFCRLGNGGPEGKLTVLRFSKDLTSQLQPRKPPPVYSLNRTFCSPQTLPRQTQQKQVEAATISKPDTSSQPGGSGSVAGRSFHVLCCQAGAVAVAAAQPITTTVLQRYIGHKAVPHAHLTLSNAEYKPQQVQRPVRPQLQHQRAPVSLALI